jgi:hypothetical protein
MNLIFQVRDSKGNILSQKEDISRGKFSFVTENYDTFEICFISKVPPRKYRNGYQSNLGIYMESGSA